MATLKQRLHKKNSSGGYDTVHLETSASVVLMSDGTTAEAAINGKAPTSHSHTKSQITDFPTTMIPASHEHAASNVTSGTFDAARIPNLAASKITSGTLVVDRLPTVTVDKGGTGATTAAAARTNLGAAASSHNHAASNITSGTLPVARGGTGVTSLDALKSALGIVAGSGTSYDISNAGVGNFVRWANATWIVVHAESDRIYLAATFIQTTTIFGSNTAYAGSTLAAVAMTYQNSIPSDSLALAVNTTVNGVTSKIFVPSYEQMNGGFVYFYSNSQRELNSTIYWTSSPYDSGRVWYVRADGSLGNYGYPSAAYGFRPFVALKR